jgi:hypothetical protein
MQAEMLFWGGALGKVSQLLILSGNFVNFTDLDSE